ncbi:MAG: hypothetical protein E7462_03500 [Ruminococcaceae bacterium]|nr:hypothetical protein [Oscillospiraceae bacterium]
MKKLIALMMAVAMVLCFAACDNGTAPDTQGTVPAEKSFTFTYQGTEITFGAPAEPILAALGEEKTYTESASCAFEGLDKTYGYGSFYLTTYPMDGKDYIYAWYFVDDMVENEEGIHIGSTQAEVEKAYGKDGFNGTNSYTMKKGNGMLVILLENELVSSIQYTMLTD